MKNLTVNKIIIIEIDIIIQLLTKIIANLNYFKKYFEFELKGKISDSKLYRIRTLIY